MRRTIFPFKIILVLFCICFFSCQELEDINQNPNSLTEMPDTYLFTNAAKWSCSEARQLLSRAQIFFTGSWSHLYSTPYAEDRYEVNADTEDEAIVWHDLYTTELRNACTLVKITSEEGTSPNAVRNAMAQIVSFITYIKLTDLFGSIPYTEGGKGFSDDIITPVYDTQEFIYHDIITRLGDCIIVFETGNEADGYGVADPFYSGKLDKWIKFANSFRLRLAMRMRFADPSGAAAAITACLGKPLMESNDDNAKIRNFEATSTYLYSGWYETFQNEGKSCRPGRMLIDFLKSTDDPRLPVFAIANTSGNYEGMPNGITNAARALIADADISKWQPVMYAKTIPSYWLCYSEVCFLKAEAALYSLGGSGTNTHYQNGIRAAMAQWGVNETQINLFLAVEPEASLTGNTEDNFRKICTQLWLSCITNNYEAYNVVRRTGYPVIPVRTGNEDPELALGITNGQLPGRLTYPSTEVTMNKANYDAAVATQGADLRTTKVWWDAK